MQQPSLVFHSNSELLEGPVFDHDNELLYFVSILDGIAYCLNAKTKEILAIQKDWESIGSMPKEKAKEINKKFWGGFKTFFHHKSEFFKSLDSKREENLKLKQEIISYLIMD